MKKKVKKSWDLTSINHFHDERGNLSVAEFGLHFDFKVERLFYLSNIVKESQRGCHAHEELKQFIICVSGSFDIELDNGKEKSIIKLSNNGYGLFVDGLVWRTMYNFTHDAVMIVLCDRVYTDDIVIRNYDDFLKRVSDD